MLPDITEIAKIRIANDWSYERLARDLRDVTEAETITAPALYRLLKGETQPSEKTRRHLKTYLSRKAAKVTRRGSRRPQ